MLAAAVALALESNVSGKLATWRNPDSGSNGTVEPVRTFRAASGQWCREYIQTADLTTESIQSERRRGIACRDSDGQWRTRVELLESSL
jgi:surface antigen